MKTSDFLAAGLLALVLWGGNLTPPTPTPTPAPALTAPGPQLQAIVLPIAAVVTGTKATEDRSALADYYAAWADLLERDGTGKKLVATTAVLAEANATAGGLMFQQTGIAGRYDQGKKLSSTIDQALGTWIGIADGKGGFLNEALDDGKRAKAVEFARAMQWALSQAEKPKA